MKSKQTRGLQAFRRVEAWFAAHPDVIPASGSSATALASRVDALKSVIERMSAQAATQTTQDQQTTLAAKDEKRLRHELRTLHMRAIVRVAHALHGTVPGMGIFKMPAPGATSESLVHAAEALHTTAALYADVFVEHGLPSDFLEQLAAATSALKGSVDARGLARSRRTEATTSIGNDLELGRRVVSTIDASLAHALKDQPATLAAWRQAKRVTAKVGPVHLALGPIPAEVSPTPPAVGATPPVAGGTLPVVPAAPPASVAGTRVA